MSLSLAAPIARALDEQARSLVTFLAAHAHELAPAQAAHALANLPADPKAAAKELRVRLRPHGVELKHTHALKAVAVARDAPGVLGLGGEERWAVYSWSPDVPSLSAQPERFTTIRAAADELCGRIRAEYEGAHPSVDLTVSRMAFRFHATSLATGTSWKSLLVRLNAEGVPIEISLSEAKQLAERVRRLGEGELHGWVGGISAIEWMYSDESSSAARDSSKLLSHDGWLLDEVMSAVGVAIPEEMPLEIPRLTKWRDQPPLSLEAWQALRKRCIRFYGAHAAMPEDWCVEQLAVPDFDGIPINTELVETLCAKHDLSFPQLEMRAGTGGNVAESLARGQLGLQDFAGVARVLGLEGPNDLLPRVSAVPRIPLPDGEVLALWLSRIDKLNVDVVDAEADGASALVTQLIAQCDVPFQARRSWGTKAPASLRAAHAAIAAAQLVVCARMDVRFIKDLPIDEWRPTTICVLSLEKASDVSSQDGKLGPSEEDSVTPEWLERFNKPRFTGTEMMRYSDRAQELAKKHGTNGEHDNFFAQVMAGQEVFGKDHARINSAHLRMEALSRLMQSHPLEPWIRRSSDGEGSLMIQEAAFEATAGCELVNVVGRPGFDVQSFFLLCATHDRAAA